MSKAGTIGQIRKVIGQEVPGAWCRLGPYPRVFSSPGMLLITLFRSLQPLTWLVMQFTPPRGGTRGPENSLIQLPYKALHDYSLKH